MNGEVQRAAAATAGRSFQRSKVSSPGRAVHGLSSASSLLLVLLPLLGSLVNVARADPRVWDSSLYDEDKSSIALATKADPDFNLFNDDNNTTVDGQDVVALKKAMALETMFQQWSTATGHQYPDDASQSQARANFESNVAKVYQINSDPSIPFAVDCNDFCDVSDDDFLSQYLMPPRSPADDPRATTGVSDTQGGDSNSSSSDGDVVATDAQQQQPNPADLGRRGGFGNSSLSSSNGFTAGPHRRQLTTVTVTYLSFTIPSTTPSAMDWRNSGYLPPIRNQGKCGCCWAFAGNAVVEIAYTMLYGTSIASTLSLAHQQIVSCAQTLYGYCSNGCKGGYIDEAIYYSSQLNGQNLTTTVIYPYTSRTTGITGVCNTSILSKTGPGDVAQIASAGVIKLYPVPLGYTAETMLMGAVSVAPVAVYMYAGSNFKLYRSGIYDPSLDCSPTSSTYNHGIVIVGYNNVPGTTPYWILRNSWGTAWGMYGYAYMLMTSTSWPYGPCGMYQQGYQAYKGAPFTKVLSAVNAG